MWFKPEAKHYKNKTNCYIPSVTVLKWLVMIYGCFTGDYFFIFEYSLNVCVVLPGFVFEEVKLFNSLKKPYYFPYSYLPPK